MANGPITTPKIDLGTGGNMDLGSSVLPFSLAARQGEQEGIIVQIKVLGDNEAETLRVVELLQRELTRLQITVNGKRIVLVTTSENAEMTRADVERIATLILPSVFRALNIPVKGNIGA